MLSPITKVEGDLLTPASAATTHLFQQEWWLHAAGGVGLRSVQVQWDGVTVGKLYYIQRNVAGLRLIGAPPYTRTLGPHLSLPPSKPETRMTNVCRVVKELVTALPKCDRFNTFLEPGNETAFAFQLAGCTIELDFTFRVDSRDGIDKFWAALNPKTRNLIRTTDKRLVIEESSDPEEYIELSHREHPKSKWHSFERLRILMRELQERGQMTVHIARNDAGHAIATSVLVWDDNMLYYWLASRDPKLSDAGSNSLLIWKAIELAHSKGLGFDFDGYHSLAQARFASKFGLTPVIRPNVIRLSNRGYIVRRGAELMGRSFGGNKTT